MMSSCTGMGEGVEGKYIYYHDPDSNALLDPDSNSVSFNAYAERSRFKEDFFIKKK